MKRSVSSEAPGTALGIVAIVLWSTNIAFSRRLAIDLGTLTAGATLFIGSGLLACLPLMRKRRMREVLALPNLYLFGCGLLFVLYEVCLYVAIGIAGDDRRAMEVGLLNYLWPTFTLLFAVPILREKAKVWLIPGILMGAAGIYVAGTEGAEFSLAGFAQTARANFWPYLLALAAAVLWALYSNLTRLWVGHSRIGAVPLFLLASGVVLLIARFWFEETPRWRAETVAATIYMILLPTLLAYSFWDAAMRKGNVILVAALAYFIPLLSTLFSGLYLGVPLTRRLLVACALLVAGAIVCKFSLRERAKAQTL